MGKILCQCGHVILNQSDLMRNKAHFIADQDYFDFFDKTKDNDFAQTTAEALKYFHEVFQCTNCHSLVIFRQNAQRGIFFTPSEKHQSQHILDSYLGEKWPGTISANFNHEKGDIYWQTNYESGYRSELGLEELRTFYKAKFAELSSLKILSHSFLRVDGEEEHSFSADNK